MGSVTVLLALIVLLESQDGRCSACCGNSFDYTNPTGEYEDSEGEDKSIKRSMKMSLCEKYYKKFPKVKKVTSHSELIRSLDKFSTKLLGVFLKLHNDSDSFVISPYGIHVMLSLLSYGAKGFTRSVLLKAIHAKDVRKLKREHAYLREMFSEDRSAITLSNQLYCNPSLDYTMTFYTAAICDYQFHLGNFTDDYIQNPKGMNRQVVQDTDGAIKNFSTKRDFLDPRAVMLMMNAAVFNENWKEQFKKEKKGQTQNFYLPNGRCQKMVYMRKKLESQFLFEENIDAYLINLDYFNSTMSMVVIWPEDKTKLDKLEASLETEYPDQLSNLFLKLQNNSEEQIDLKFPKFEIEQGRHDLKPPLTTMGIEAIFDFFKPDFSFIPTLIVPNISPLFLSRMFQQTRISVNEKGTYGKDDAKLPAGGKKKHSPSHFTGDVQELTIDQPFLFFIKDNEYNAILFYGRYTGDNKKKKVPC